MHIMEGFLPLEWCLFWYVVALPVVAYGVIQIKKITDENPESKPLLAVSGAFIFVLSSLKLPSVQEVVLTLQALVWVPYYLDLQ